MKSIRFLLCMMLMSVAGGAFADVATVSGTLSEAVAAAVGGVKL